MLLISFKGVLLSLCVLIGVAYFTLLERKVLGSMQLRKGPDKVSIWGLLQPICDAMKLFLKETFYPLLANSLLFAMPPVVGLVISLSLWMLYSSTYAVNYHNYMLMLFIGLTGLLVHSIIFAGWGSNSKYAFYGAMRAAAQSISYEVTLMILLFFPVYCKMTYSWGDAAVGGKPGLLCLPMGLVWISICLAESHRAPFDFAEGESELVSGFNVEFMGGLFAMLFLAEYSSILFMSFTTVVWVGGSSYYTVIMTLSMVVALMFLWARGVYPRFRYDFLMSLCWGCFLPFSLSVMIYWSVFAASAA